MISDQATLQIYLGAIRELFNH